MKKEASLVSLLYILLIVGCTTQVTTPTNISFSDPQSVQSATSENTEFNSIRQEIDYWYNQGKRQIGPEHYQRLLQQLRAFKNVPQAEITSYQQKLDAIVINEQTITSDHRDQTQSQKSDYQKQSTSQISESDHPTGLTSLQNPGYTEKIAVSDGIAASLSRDRVMTKINIANALSPIIQETIDTPSFAETIYSDNQYTYLGDSREFRIQDKKSGNVIGSYSSDWAAALTVDRGYAYLASSDKLQILNIQDPAKIQKSSQITLTGRAPSKVIVKDGYAYVVETLGGLNIVNVANPASPKIVKVMPFESHTVGFGIQGNYAYLGRISSTKSDGQGYAQESVIEVIDISEPSTAKIFASIILPTGIKDMAIGGKYAYFLGTYPYRLGAVDISVAQKPQLLKTAESIVGNADLQAITIHDNYAFIADGNLGLRIMDVSNPAKPVPIKELDLQGRAFSVNSFGSDLYVGVEKKYFNIADLRNPEKPRNLHSESFPGSYEYTSVVIKNKNFFFNGGGAHIYDLSDPTYPKKRNQNPIEADSIQVQDNYMYSTIGEIGLLVYDISTIIAPTLVSKTPFIQGIPRDLSVDGRWAVGISNTPYSISVFDISNPQKPIAGDVYQYQKYPFAVTVQNDHVYVARGEDGVDIFQITNNGKLELQKNIATNGRYAQSVTVSGDKAFILKDGIDIYDISDPQNPRFLDHTNSNGQAVRAAIENDFMYIADGYAGVTIAKIPPLD